MILNYDNKQYFAARLNNLVDHFSITEGHLMKACSVSKSAVCRWRLGRTIPREVEPIARLVGCSVRELELYLAGDNDVLQGLFRDVKIADGFVYDKMVILSALHFKLSVFEVGPEHIAKLTNKPVEEVALWRNGSVPTEGVQAFCKSLGFHHLRLQNTPLWKVKKLMSRVSLVPNQPVKRRYQSAVDAVA